MIKELNYTQLKDIYKQYMVNDFPENELKSYSMIRKCIKNKECIAIGYYDNDELKGYATVLIAERVLLLDYYAILLPFRKMGYGSIFLEEISAYFKDYDVLLIEAEADDNPVARKRIDFYHHCGCRDSGVKGRLYFVDYVLLYKELSRTYSLQEIEDAIHRTYHLVYPHFENTKYLIFY